MNLIIGVRGVARELKLTNVDLTESDLTAKLQQATSDGAPLILDNSDGRKLLIPADAIGYLELTEDERRPVGFLR